jgi:hypothetical protein
MIRGCIHMKGSRIVRGTTTAPANPANPTVIPIVIMAARLSLIPIKLATSLSCAVERIASPSLVFMSKTRSAERMIRTRPKVSNC